MARVRCHFVYLLCSRNLTCGPTLALWGSWIALGHIKLPFRRIVGVFCEAKNTFIK